VNELLLAGSYKFLVPLSGALIAVQELSDSEPVRAIILGGLVAAALTSMGIALTKTIRSITRAYEAVTDYMEEVRARLTKLEHRQEQIQKRLGIPEDEI